MEDMVIRDIMNDVFLKKFTLRSVAGRGGQEGGYLEDVEGS